MHVIWNHIRPTLYPHRFKLVILFVSPIIWCLAETIAPFLIKLLIDRVSLLETRSTQLISFLLVIASAYAGMMVILEGSLRLCNWMWIETFPKVREAHP